MSNRTLVLLLGLVFLRVPSLRAQDAVLNCTVVDSSNAPVPGATAVLKNIATGIMTESISNDRGLVSFPSARPGRYELTVSLDGFAPITIAALRLEVGESRAVTARLEPKGVQEMVTVSRPAPSPGRCRRRSLTGFVADSRVAWCDCNGGGFRGRHRCVLWLLPCASRRPLGSDRSAQARIGVIATQRVGR